LTFSAAQQLFPNPKYRELADRAYEYLKKYFVDEQFGGVYWSVTAKAFRWKQRSNCMEMRLPLWLFQNTTRFQK
jgi:hypothetical protein